MFNPDTDFEKSKGEVYVWLDPPPTSPHGDYDTHTLL
jgi:hypothetical protein